MHITTIPRQQLSLAQSPLIHEHRSLPASMNAARGLTFASAIGACIWGAVAGAVWYLV